VQKYFVSENWKEHHIFIGDEYLVDQSTMKVLNQLKLGMIVKMLHDNLTKVKEAQSEDELNQLLEIHAALDEYKNNFARNLGRVVLPTMKQFQNQ
jgi:hypothetical protein